MLFWCKIVTKLDAEDVAKVAAAGWTGEDLVCATLHKLQLLDLSLAAKAAVHAAVLTQTWDGMDD